MSPCYPTSEAACRYNDARSPRGFLALRYRRRDTIIKSAGEPRIGITFSVQWEPPERLRRDPFDRHTQRWPEFEPAGTPGRRLVRGAGVTRTAVRDGRDAPSSIQGMSRPSRWHNSTAASNSPPPVAAAYRSR